MKQLIVDYGIIYNRLAILEDEKLVEILIENKYDKSLVGNIYLGRVCNVLKSMSAAFVDIGITKNGYLQLDNDSIKNGSEIFVQVKKDPVGEKGATLSTEVSLSGQYVVLIPEKKQRLVSKKIKDKNEIERLLSIVKKCLTDEHGVIIRTDASEVESHIIEEEVLDLHEKWNNIKQKKNRILKDKLIFEDYSFDDMILKEYSSQVDQIVMKKNKYNPDSTKNFDGKIEFYDGDYPIFEFYKIESQIKESLSREVKLHQGSFITIDETEAMTVIDINSGKYIGSNNKEETFLQVNLAAAKEVARQIKLRNVSGIIMIDFINMKTKTNYDFLISVLDKYFRQDKCLPKIHSLTSLGLIEVTRRKNRKSLNTIILKSCGICSGSGYHYSDDIIFTQFIQKIERLIIHTGKSIFNINVSEHMYKLLNSQFYDGKTYKNLLEYEYDIEIELAIKKELTNYEYETSGK